ncbi:MAG: hypothetical protein K0R27_186 [Xanthobacteraceae bacterium]|jgi:hypothetical protein|nr:hypothetical protein [Xanthobacteraceae bacterium]
MIPASAYLDEPDRAVFRTIVAFLKKRLAETATIDWALRLTSAQRIERLAINDLLNSLGGGIRDEPWATAWRLIEESWSARSNEESSSTEIYHIQERLALGDRSGWVISSIVSLVAPRLRVEPIRPSRLRPLKKSRYPKTFNDLLSATLTSGDLVDLTVVELLHITEVDFLKSLGIALDSAVIHGLEIARRLGWDGQRRLWQLGQLGRVYYVSIGPWAGGDERDPDTFHSGIAPSVKLLCTVVARLAELEAGAALPFIRRWQLNESPVHTRLWAAAARNPELVGPTEVDAFLADIDDHHFWDIYSFPEVAELRARRFGELGAQSQKAIVKRLRKGPPRSFWPREAEAAKINRGQLYWTIRELKRIEIAGENLLGDDSVWMDANIGRFADLGAMKLDEGFPEAPRAYDVLPSVDTTYDTLSGITRLRALETALSAGRGNWDDDTADRASYWLRQPKNTELVLGDLKVAESGGDGLAHVWNRFGWAHSPSQQETIGTPQNDLQTEIDDILTLLHQLSEGTLSVAIEGISAWLDAWNKQVALSALGVPVWLRIWPIAIQATNATPESADDDDLSATIRSLNDEQEPRDLDTLNTPTGKLVGVFLATCPPLINGSNPFETDSKALQMRNALANATGRSGLIVLHRLIEHLPYFLQADRDWTERYLIAPLLNDDDASVALWRAIARRSHFTEVLEIIGSAMANRATDRRLGRESRRRLVFSLVIESLHAFNENREPAVPHARVQQMLRNLDDEVRHAAANAIQQFVRELSENVSGVPEARSAADVFRSAAAPFLQHVWPQERSLTTPGVSNALADLPATSGEAFVEAVDAIERFLVPFESWSMHDYGLHGQGNYEKQLSTIDSEAKADAFLRLLDLTVGTSESAVIPYDLTDALDQIKSVAPKLMESPTYRRLSTAARR